MPRPASLSLLLRTRRGARRSAAALAVALAAAGAGPLAPARGQETASAARPAAHIPPQFVGLSVEWSLIERYMGPNARPAFARLLGNLGSGVLRIGGSSQDLMQFQPDAPNTLRNITPDDLRAIRATLDRVNGDRRGRGGRPADWGTILGTALAPPDEDRPWVGPAHAKSFTTQGVAPAFGGPAARFVTSIGLGNEPDLSYDGDLARYLADARAYQDAGVTRPYALDLPSTSEPIAPWARIAAHDVDTRFFFDWPQILDAIGPSTLAVRAPQGAATTDHFYPTARGCTSDPYRCATIERLLSDERMANFDYLVATHAGEAAARGLSYRLGELNSAANRGADGVSNVAASATWALDTMFHAACPQPPDRPGANADCRTGAIGVNFHDSEVRAFFAPEEGNAYYNAVDYDPSPAAGAPTVRPLYYALLFFGRFAQDTTGLRPIVVAGAPTSVKGWQVGTAGGGSRRFLINKGAAAVTVPVPAGGPVEVHRMTPSDPTGAGRTLDAPAVVVDGRSAAADGSWPGFAGQTAAPADGTVAVTLLPGEAATVEPAG